MNCHECADTLQRQLDGERVPSTPGLDRHLAECPGCRGLFAAARRLDPDLLPTVRHLVTTKSWWDTVDALASRVVGTILARYPAAVSTMDSWLADGNLWVARTAILHQNHSKGRTDPDVLFGYCLRRAADPEFFIRKAIGWALREYSKTDAEAVERFVREHHDELSGLSRTEALKWLRRRGRVGA